MNARIKNPGDRLILVLRGVDPAQRGKTIPDWVTEDMNIVFEVPEYDGYNAEPMLTLEAFSLKSGYLWRDCFVGPEIVDGIQHLNDLEGILPDVQRLEAIAQIKRWVKNFEKEVEYYEREAFLSSIDDEMTQDEIDAKHRARRFPKLSF